MLDHSLTVASQRLTSFLHKLTYRSLPASQTQNILVIGGSYTGIHLARRLARSLPTGFKVVLVEKRSHFYHCFNFPRYSVLPGRESNAFIPYDRVGYGTPRGIFELVRDEVTKLNGNEIVLKSGSRLRFAFAAVATGATLPAPARREDCCCGRRSGGCAACGGY